ncbi:MAG: cupin domain-containing protein [Cyclobacteriaceae bacterium]
MMSYKIDFSSLDWTQKPGAQQKEVIFGENKMRLLELDDSFVEQTWCEKGHYGYVLEGTLSIVFGGELVTFNAGDGMVIPSGTKHKAVVASGDKAVLMLLEEVEE